jgi:hypothetical protein
VFDWSFQAIEPSAGFWGLKGRGAIISGKKIYITRPRTPTAAFQYAQCHLCHGARPFPSMCSEQNRWAMLSPL